MVSDRRSCSYPLSSPERIDSFFLALITPWFLHQLHSVCIFICSLFGISPSFLFISPAFLFLFFVCYFYTTFCSLFHFLPFLNTVSSNSLLLPALLHSRSTIPSLFPAFPFFFPSIIFFLFFNFFHAKLTLFFLCVAFSTGKMPTSSRRHICHRRLRKRWKGKL